jgi:uncharacterized membrane protein YhaH (DUF805 family)
MPRDLPNWDDPGFWTWPGCVTILGIFLSFIGVAAGVTAAIFRDTDALLLVIVFLLAGILFLLSTKAR